MTSEDETAEDHNGPRPYIDHRQAPTRIGLIVPDVRGSTSGHSIEARKAEFEGLASEHEAEIDALFARLSDSDLEALTEILKRMGKS